MDDNEQFTVGDPDAQRDFLRRHRAFIERLPNFAVPANLIRAKATTKDGLEQRVIFSLANLVFEDFEEILILLANGYSTGAMKILRSLFEDTVTLTYLSTRPAEIEKFWTYHAISERKEVRKLEAASPGAFEKSFLAQLEANYKRYAPRYEQGKGKSKRVSTSWGKPMTQMAEEAGFDPNIIECGYYRPLQEAHTTPGAVIRRLRSKPGGGWDFDSDAKPGEDKVTLVTAHFLYTRAIEVCFDYFGLHGDEEVERAKEQMMKDQREIWPAKAASTGE